MLSIVVPCHNDARNAPLVANGLLPVTASLAERMRVELIFVNDGSTDNTQAIFEWLCERAAEQGVRAWVLQHDRQRGPGSALQTGFRAARGSILITTRCDATYTFQEIPALLARMTDAVDVVTASPHHPRGSDAAMPVHRRVLGRAAAWIYRRLVTARLHSYSSVFSAYRRVVLENVPFSSGGAIAGTEILVNAVLGGFGIAEHPTKLRAPRPGGARATLLRTAVAHLVFQARLVYARVSRHRIEWVVERPDYARPALCAGASGPTVVGFVKRRRLR